MTIKTGVPECGSTEPHRFHNKTWIDEHFKSQSVWCHGLCDCGMSGYPKVHGPGEHK